MARQLGWPVPRPLPFTGSPTQLSQSAWAHSGGGGQAVPLCLEGLAQLSSTTACSRDRAQWLWRWQVVPAAPRCQSLHRQQQLTQDRAAAAVDCGTHVPNPEAEKANSLHDLRGPHLRVSPATKPRTDSLSSRGGPKTDRGCPTQPQGGSRWAKSGSEVRSAPCIPPSKTVRSSKKSTKTHVYHKIVLIESCWLSRPPLLASKRTPRFLRMAQGCPRWFQAAPEGHSMAPN
jgi:hypothetical protein